MLLAVDTSTRITGVALHDGDQVLSELVWINRENHTVELAPAIEQTLRRGGIELAELQALAVALGPGSFTALRVGLALVKGMALAGKLPLVGVPTLDFLAAAQPVMEGALAAVLRAGRGRLAVGWYHPRSGSWQPSGEVEVLTAEELSRRIKSPTAVCGELEEAERRLLARKRKNVILASPAQSVRRPAYLAELGWKRWQAGEVDEPAGLAPLYLHRNIPAAA